MGVGAAIGLGAASILGGRDKRKASKSAADAQVAAAEIAADEQRAARKSFEKRTDPFRVAGLSAAIPILSELGIQIPDSLLGSAGFKGRPGGQLTTIEDVNPLVSFVRDQGFEDIQESAAAQGRLRSGGTLQDLTEFNTQVASTVVPQLQQQRFNNLFNLLGLGANVAAGQGTAGLQTAANIGNLTTQAGQAQAQGILGASQANQGVLSDIAGIGGLFASGAFNRSPTIQDFGGPTGFGASGFAGTFGI